MIENVAREDLTVIEEATAIALLLDDLHVTTARLARGLDEAAATSRTPSACSNSPTKQSS